MLQADLFSLSSRVEAAIAKSLTGLRNRDLELSHQVVEEDEAIDQKRLELEEHCVDLIAMQQPTAVDLRLLMSVLYIANELERMGDYAEGIAKISIMMGDEPPLKPLIDIPRMADRATLMLEHSLEALVNRDAAAAAQVCDDDDEVDALYEQIYRELLTYMMEDPQTIQRATYLLWVAHNLERIADRATNIAERVIFLVTGKLTDSSASKY
jgi:phosphate transport system protein